jgi:hypothetical protein
MSQDFTGWLSFDLECNMAQEGDVRGPFHKRATRILCIVTKDIGTGEIREFGMDEIDEGLAHLVAAPGLVAHNGKDFDLKVITNLRPDLAEVFKDKPMADTLKMSRQLFGRSGDKLLAYDLKTFNSSHNQPHALKYWGFRLKFPKMEDFEDVDWATVDCSPKLIEYCLQDVVITDKLFHYLMKKRAKNAL